MPQTLILSSSISEANDYAKRAGLQRFTYRAVRNAGAIRGIRNAEVHLLPSFLDRPDRHRILSVLGYAHTLEIFYVDPADFAPWTRPARDQGDGMGEQTTIEDFIREELDSGPSPEHLTAEAAIGEHEDRMDALEERADSTLAAAEAIDTRTAEAETIAPAEETSEPTGETEPSEDPAPAEPTPISKPRGKRAPTKPRPTKPKPALPAADDFFG